MHPRRTQGHTDPRRMASPSPPCIGARTATLSKTGFDLQDNLSKVSSQDQFLPGERAEARANGEDAQTPG